VSEKVKVLLLLATKYRHNLTYSAAECVMKLAGVLSKENLSCPSKHILKTTIELYSSALSEHHLCPECGFYVGTFDIMKQCNNCHYEIDEKRNKKNGNFFLYLSVAEQIAFLLRCGLADELVQPENRDKIRNGNYEDIYDGRLYKKLVASGCLSFNFFY